jgi:DNA-binding response OmpR family regulator
MRFLVVEHHDGIAAVIREVIRNRGHEPLVVPTADAASTVLERDRPDAILLDVALPGTSALDFLQLPAVRAADIPSVVVGQLVTEEQARECLRAGALDVVAGDASLELLQHVVAYLELRASQVQREQTDHPSERRRSPRAAIAIPIRVFDRTEWEGVSVNLSTFGVKIRPRRPVTPGPSVRLQFALPDDQDPLFVLAQFSRTDDAEHVYRFVNLTPTEHRRLDTLVQRLKSD